MDVLTTSLSFQEWIGLILSYGLGCFATGYYWIRWKKGLDLRYLGSGNVGAKNAGRVLGKSGFALTFVGDFLKGVFAVGLARILDFSLLAVIGCMLMVVIGHNWPVQLGFRGGKGISTSIGAMLLVDPATVAFGLLVFLLLFIIFRSFTLCGLMTFLFSPFISWLCHPDSTVWVGIFALTTIVLLSHHKNIGTELHRSKPITKVEGEKTF